MLKFLHCWHKWIVMQLFARIRFYRRHQKSYGSIIDTLSPLPLMKDKYIIGALSKVSLYQHYRSLYCSIFTMKGIYTKTDYAIDMQKGKIDGRYKFIVK